MDKLLSTSKQLERLKDSFNAEMKINMLAVFKKIDILEKGVIKADDIRKFYYSVGGLPIRGDFDLLVLKYSRSLDSELSYSEFVEIFSNSQLEDTFHNIDTYIPQEAYRIICQIIMMTIEAEVDLIRTIHKLRKGEAKMLFTQINLANTGFINYQELKKFVGELGKNLTMQELMTVLKRLDKSKNGVVVEEEFLQFFEPIKY